MLKLETLEKLTQLDMDLAFLSSLIDDFLTDGEDLLADLKTAAEEGNAREFRDILHGLRGSAMNIGGDRLYRLLLSYRSTGQHDLEQNGKEYVERVSEEFYSLRGALSQYLREHSEAKPNQ